MDFLTEFTEDDFIILSREDLMETIKRDLIELKANIGVINVIKQKYAFSRYLLSVSATSIIEDNLFNLKSMTD